MAYADDVVVMTEKKEEMQSMIERFREYLEEKKLELNADKTKIMTFRKGGRKRDSRM